MKSEDFIHATEASSVDLTSGLGESSLIESVHQIAVELSTGEQVEAESLPAQFLKELTQTSSVVAGVWFRTHADSGDVELLHSSGFDDEPSAANSLAAHAAEQSTGRSDSSRPFQMHSVKLGNESLSATVVISASTASSQRAVLVAATRDQLTSDEMLSLDSAMKLITLAADASTGDRQRAVMSEQDIARLIGIIAHELRTPLTSLRGNIQLAQMSVEKRELQRVSSRLHTALESVDSMTSLIHTLLDVSRIERGSYQFQKSTDDLAVTLHNAVRRVVAAGSRPTVDIVFENDTPVEHYHDRVALQRAVSNLLSSILPLVEDDSEIEVRLAKRDATTVVDLRFRGRVFSNADQLALTRPLYGSVHSDDSRHREALRLDLAFVRGVVSSHGGSIRVDNLGSDNVRRVRLDLPAHPPEQ